MANFLLKDTKRKAPIQKIIFVWVAKEERLAESLIVGDILLLGRQVTDVELPPRSNYQVYMLPYAVY